MPLLVFPSIPKPQYLYIFEQEYKTQISPYETGLEYRRRGWRFPKRTFLLRYNVLKMTAAGRDALYEFFVQCQGAYVPFYYFDVGMRRIIDEFVAYGDGIEDEFELPSKNTTEDATLNLYVNGVEVNWSFSAGTGPNGEDVITLIDGAPAEGALITADFNGKLRIQGRFKDDKMSEEVFTTYLTRFGLSIYEVKE